ncbi:MAG: hypothetical protein CMK59_06590 [Proteobacteria bacterium]|nr:hypothetical protein [Pseudomonadota bacterium]
MTSSLRILFEADNPAGEECAVEDLALLISEGKIKEDTQVWNQESGCWESASKSMLTKHLFVQNVDIWDAWDESSFRRINANRSQKSNESISQHSEYVQNEVLPATDCIDAISSNSQQESIDSEADSPTQFQSNNWNLPVEALEEVFQKSQLHQVKDPQDELAQAEVIEKNLEEKNLEGIEQKSVPNKSLSVEEHSSAERELPYVPLEQLLTRGALIEQDLLDAEKEKKRQIHSSSQRQSKDFVPTSKTNSNSVSSDLNRANYFASTSSVRESRHGVGQSPQLNKNTEMSNRNTIERADISELFNLELPKRPPLSDNTGSVRWIRVFSLTFVMGMIVLIFRWYVVSTVNTPIAKRPEPIIDDPVLVEQDIYSDLEQDLREKLPVNIKQISPDSDIEDVFFVSLLRQQVPITKVKGKVLEWGGRKLDKPLNAEIRITIESSGEIEQEIASIALLEGLYMEHYAMTFDDFDVVMILDGSHLERSIPPRLAHRFYLGELSLSSFFESFLSGEYE